MSDNKNKNDTDNDNDNKQDVTTVGLSSTLSRFERRSYNGVSPASTSKNSHTPLTVFAKHKIQPGKEDLFEKWLQELLLIQRRDYQGFLGLEVIRPNCCSSNERVSIFRYDTYDHLQKWMDSDDRMRLLERSSEFDEEPIQITYHSLEYWFVTTGDEPNASNATTGSATGPTVVPPPRWKMVIVTFLVIWLQVRFLASEIARIPKLPPWAGQGLGILVIVVLTTYIIMPVVTKYLLFWFLFPQKVRSLEQSNNNNKEGQENALKSSRALTAKDGKDHTSRTEASDENV